MVYAKLLRRLISERYQSFNRRSLGGWPNSPPYLSLRNRQIDQWICNRGTTDFAWHGKCLRIRRFYQGFVMEVLTSPEMERANRLTIAPGTPAFPLILTTLQPVAQPPLDLLHQRPTLPL